MRGRPAWPPEATPKSPARALQPSHQAQGSSSHLALFDLIELKQDGTRRGRSLVGPNECARRGGSPVFEADQGCPTYQVL